MVAIPLSPKDTFAKLKTLSDETICLETPAFFLAIGNFYYDFEQITDDEVKELMQNVELNIKAPDNKTFH